MIFGYILQNALGLIFALALFSLQRASFRTEDHNVLSPLKDRLSTVLARGYDCFYNCAVFFTFSIQTASTVVLVHLDYGISASNMGDSTAKITWAVSLLTLIPLMYVAYIPDLLQSQQLEHHPKQKSRFSLFVICWLLSLYPFYGKMMCYFGPTLIGNGVAQVISDRDWNVIQASCTANVKSISAREKKAIELFGVLGSLLLSICTLSKIIWLGAQRQHKDSKFVQRLRKCPPIQNAKLLIMLSIVLPIFAVSQIWTILRLRHFQKQISKNTGNVDSDDQWTFGQIIAVTVFIPVVVECWFSWQQD